MVNLFQPKNSLITQPKRFVVNFHNWESDFRRYGAWNDDSYWASFMADQLIEPYDKADPPGWFDIHGHGAYDDEGIYAKKAPTAILSVDKPSDDTKHYDDNGWDGTYITAGDFADNIESYLSVESLARMIIEGLLGADADSLAELRETVGDDVADRVIKELQNGIPEGTNIRLISCDAGVYYEAYDKYQAQELATLTNRCIIAPNTAVTQTLHSEKKDPKTGSAMQVVQMRAGPNAEWRLFVPGGPDFLEKHGYKPGTKYIVIGHGIKSGSSGGDDLEVATANANKVLKKLGLDQESVLAAKKEVKTDKTPENTNK